MNILLDNINLNSPSGPNHFASKLKKYMSKQGDTFNSDEKYDAQLSFINRLQRVPDTPIFQRLDGIYFNSSQDFQAMNEVIADTYRQAHGVVFQSEFNRKLTFEYFGEHGNYEVIHNGADLELIQEIPTLSHPGLDRYENVWSCASSWRPHKRLKQNVEYFLDHASERDCMIVAGATNERPIEDSRVYYVGDLDIPSLISLYKRSRFFVHLAYLDHCPNVVVDATACGCEIICSSTGGTKEIAIGATLIGEEEWDYSPIELYSPRKMDFSNKRKNEHTPNIDMNYVAAKYNKFLGA